MIRRRLSDRCQLSSAATLSRICSPATSVPPKLRWPPRPVSPALDHLAPRRRRLAACLAGTALVLAAVLWAQDAPTASGAHVGVAQLVPPSERGLVRAQVDLVPRATGSAHPLLLTVGGPEYCVQIAALARYLHANRLCTDYGPNGYVRPGTRALRLEDWGDPAYDEAVARLPARLRSLGVRTSRLIVVGVSYTGYADAELVATHPELRPAALLVIDSYLDLPARYLALPRSHETRKEIERAIGGTLAAKPQAYAERSPSHHLQGLAQAIRGGMRFLDIWSVADSEQHEFNGATCDASANAGWLPKLASLVGRPATGYVTQLGHGHALWNYGHSLLALAGFAPSARPLPARTVVFRPHGPVPAASVCAPGRVFRT